MKREEQTKDIEKKSEILTFDELDPILKECQRSNNTEFSKNIQLELETLKSFLTEEKPTKNSKKRKDATDNTDKLLETTPAFDFASILDSNQDAKFQEFQQNDNNNNFQSDSQTVTFKKKKKECLITKTKTLEGGKEIYALDGTILQFKEPKMGAFQDFWSAHFEKLVEFKNLFGHSNPTKFAIGYQELADWVIKQRLKLKQGKLTLTQFKKLQNIGNRSAFDAHIIDFEWT